MGRREPKPLGTDEIRRRVSGRVKGRRVDEEAAAIDDDGEGSIEG